MQYQVIKSKRKTMAIVIKPDGMVVIRAPLKTTIKNISELINKYQHWIERKLSQTNNIQKHNTELYFLGRAYQLEMLEDKFSNVELGINTIKSYADSIEEHKIKLIDWYKSQAKLLVMPLLDKYQKLLALKPQSIKITTAKGRWGSCNSKGNLCFSYRVAMLPEFVIEYIVIHELCHLRHLNHSSLFWELVASTYPQYKSAEKWLKTHRYILANLFI